jgi:hypothetical protein
VRKRWWVQLELGHNSHAARRVWNLLLVSRRTDLTLVRRRCVLQSMNVSISVFFNAGVKV